MFFCYWNDCCFQIAIYSRYIWCVCIENVCLRIAIRNNKCPFTFCFRTIYLWQIVLSFFYLFISIHPSNLMMISEIFQYWNDYCFSVCSSNTNVEKIVIQCVCVCVCVYCGIKWKICLWNKQFLLSFSMPVTNLSILVNKTNSNNKKKIDNKNQLKIWWFLFIFNAKMIAFGNILVIETICNYQSQIYVQQNDKVIHLFSFCSFFCLHFSLSNSNRQLIRFFCFCCCCCRIHNYTNVKISLNKINFPFLNRTNNNNNNSSKYHIQKIILLKNLTFFTSIQFNLSLTIVKKKFCFFFQLSKTWFNFLISIYFFCCCIQKHIHIIHVKKSQG